MNWEFQIRYNHCSAGLHHIEARSDGNNGRHRRWFGVTKSMHITKAREMLEDKAGLAERAEKIYKHRYG